MTITRDKKTGVPHIKGTTRYGTEFGAGYAAGQDRLWLMDLFRHVGRGELTSFAGGAPANQGLEQQFWPQAPYTEADLQAQVDRIRDTNGERGKQAMPTPRPTSTASTPTATQSKNGRYFPGEYVLTGHIDAITNAGEIQPFKLTDLVALASVVGGLFGNGGGGEVAVGARRCSPPSRSTASTKGTEVWESFRERNDPEAVLDPPRRQSFPYAAKPGQRRRARRCPTRGSVTAEPLVYDRTGAATAGGRRQDPVKAPRKYQKLQGIFDDGVLPGQPRPQPEARHVQRPAWSPASTPRAATRSPSSARRPATSRPSC